MKCFRVVASVGLIGVLLAGCLAGCQKSGGDRENKVAIDGSSTVFPVSKKMAEEFGKTEKGKGVRISVGVSGTGGGFDKFSTGDTDISDASRPIKNKEIEKCKKNDIEFVELKVAIDGLSVIVNKENSFCKNLTVQELRSIWIKDSNVKKWSDIRNGWPDEKIVLCGPDSKSGTYDYFKEVILGKGEDDIFRTDFSPSTNDDTLVRIVSQNKFGMGYFGYAYYKDNKEELNAVAISPKKGDPAVLPQDDTIKSGKYTPLSRPLFIYVSKKSLKRDVVANFVKFYLNEGQKFVSDAGYVDLHTKDLDESKKRLKDALK